MKSNKKNDPLKKETRHPSVFDLRTANSMLPLIRQITTDLQRVKQEKASLNRELSVLEDFRLELTWESRKRRYNLMDEIGRLDRKLEDTTGELTALGVKIDKDSSIGFPTRINDKPALFSWLPTEDRVMYWHYAGEVSRRNVPAEWFRTSDLAV
jgi:hypothetical protein